MQTRTKVFGAVTGTAAIALSLPLAATAHGEPAEEPTPSADVMAVENVPDPQGPGCDAFKEQVPGFKNLSQVPVGDALAAIPDISTFNAAISGQLNPEVNIVPVLNNGPYVVFAPTNEAFEALPAGQLDALSADPAALTQLGYYHAFLGLLGPDTVEGQRPTQDGAEMKVTGEGGDITVNDTAEVVCGGIQAANARIYLIDAVLDPAQAPDAITPTATSSTEDSDEATAEQEPPAEDATA
ncbi:fasciclin domain-containing protein [Mycolicibacterium thermoresistibile]